MNNPSLIEEPRYNVPGDRSKGATWPESWGVPEWAAWYVDALGPVVDSFRVNGDRVETRCDKSAIDSLFTRHDLLTQWAGTVPVGAVPAPDRLHLAKLTAPIGYLLSAKRNGPWPTIKASEAESLRVAIADLRALAAPARRREERASRQNALLDAPSIHPSLATLFDAMIRVSTFSVAVRDTYAEMVTHRDHHGMPDSHLKERAAGGDSVAGRWAQLVSDFPGYYKDWCAAIADARQAAGSPAVAAIMDGGELRPSHRWTTQTIVELDNLASTMHPVWAGGADGLGFIRCGLPPIPDAFHVHADAVRKRISEVRAVPLGAVATAMGPPPRSRGEDDGEFLPASAFPKAMRARLRMAAGEKRKGKRVAKRKDDDGVRYSVADARRHWPNDFPK